MVIIAAYADPDHCTNFPGADLVPCDEICDVVDLDDVLSVLQAYAGIYSCPHPTSP